MERALQLGDLHWSILTCSAVDARHLVRGSAAVSTSRPAICQPCPSEPGHPPPSVLTVVEKGPNQHQRSRTWSTNGCRSTEQVTGVARRTLVMLALAAGVLTVLCRARASSRAAVRAPQRRFRGFELPCSELSDWRLVTENLNWAQATAASESQPLPQSNNLKLNESSTTASIQLRARRKHRLRLKSQRHFGPRYSTLFHE